jgi:hypothetical protein
MKWLLIGTAFVAIGLLFGCASAERAMVAPGAAASESKASGGDAGQRMIISQAYLSLNVEEVDKAVEAIIAVAKKYNGYVVSSGNTTVIRVEAQSLPDALKEVKAIGSVTSSEVQEQDVTKQYSDTSIRLENAKAARARYLELLAKAENVEAALQVEKELERLNGEITLLESDMGNLSHLTQYATINASLHKAVKPGPVGWIFYGLYRIVEWLFVWR